MTDKASWGEIARHATPGLPMKKPSIPLGLVFSQSGPYAMMAGEMRKSALMAIDEINHSDEFDFTFAPHLRDPGGVVAAYHTACDDHISSDVFCIGSNYVWTWETNRVIREIVTSAGGRILAERLLELGETAVDHIVKEIIDRKPPAVFNTLVGESSYVFMRALHAASVNAGLSIPMLSCSLCEPELKLIGSAASVGCITSSAYFESIEGPENRAFVARWKARHGARSNPSVDG